MLAAAGVAGWALRVREHIMFYTAMAVFALYILLVQYGLRRVAARARAAAAYTKFDNCLRALRQRAE